MPTRSSTGFVPHSAPDPTRLGPRLVVLTVLCLSLVAAGAACHRTRPGVGQSGTNATENDSGVVLEVENHNWSDIEIYIVHDSRTDRLGMVTATKDATIPIPSRLRGETGVFRLIVNRVGGTDSYTSDAVSTRTGETVRLTVESQLSRSSVGVW